MTLIYDRATQRFVNRTEASAGTGTGGPTLAISQTTMTGTVPTVVGAVTLPAGEYAAPKAYYGCAHNTYYAQLKLALPDGTAVCAFADKLGGLGWATAAAGFTLGAETRLDLLLSTDGGAEMAFIHQFQF